jgi:hypothetical protein
MNHAREISEARADKPGAPDQSPNGRIGRVGGCTQDSILET